MTKLEKINELLQNEKFKDKLLAITLRNGNIKIINLDNGNSTIIKMEK